MIDPSDRQVQYEPAQVLTVSAKEKTRIARRWVFAILLIQATILIVLLNTRGIWFTLPGPDHLWAKLLWTAWHSVWLAASVAWPPSVIVGPMAVAITCLATSESRRRTLTCVVVSMILMGVPWLLAKWAIGGGTH